jgi:hypothetical protein
VTRNSTKAAEAGAFFTDMQSIYCQQGWQVCTHAQR